MYQYLKHYKPYVKKPIKYFESLLKNCIIDDLPNFDYISRLFLIKSFYYKSESSFHPNKWEWAAEEGYILTEYIKNVIRFEEYIYKYNTDFINDIIINFRLILEKNEERYLYFFKNGYLYKCKDDINLVIENSILLLNDYKIFFDRKIELLRKKELKKFLEKINEPIDSFSAISNFLKYLTI